MKAFIQRLALFLLLAFLSMEIFSRFAVDPGFYYFADSFDAKNEQSLNVFSHRPTRHVDYLFLGSSKVAASIAPQAFSEGEKGKVTVVAARGKSSFGVEYQALQHRLAIYPDYLRGAAVFLEYPGSDIYAEAFEDEQFKVTESKIPGDQDMPKLIVPHLDWPSLKAFVAKSKNRTRLKVEVCALYTSAAYRSGEFMNHVFHRLDKPLFATQESLLAEQGGIRSDNIKLTRQRAVEAVKRQKEDRATRPPLTMASMDKSALNALNDLVQKAGGKLYLFNMPLHTMFSTRFQDKKGLRDQQVFEKWLAEKGIELIYVNGFKFDDDDFPDVWHLSKMRQAEFSRMLRAAYEAGRTSP